MKKLKRVLVCLGMSTTVSAYAANPVTQEWVSAQIAAAQATQSTLSTADWSAVCQNGNINSTSGCYGDAGSQAFTKINNLGGNPLGLTGTTGSAANSVWIRQLGSGTACNATGAPLYVEAQGAATLTTSWTCGLELANGTPVSSVTSLGVLIANAAYGPGNTFAGVYFASIGKGVSATQTQMSAQALYFNSSPTQPTAYLFCISTASSGAATAFLQTPQASLGGVC